MTFTMIGNLCIYNITCLNVTAIARGLYTGFSYLLECTGVSFDLLVDVTKQQQINVIVVSQCVD